jgi:alginate O-acetyltransferase complex protein AlgI
VVWGLFHGLFMVIERLGFEKVLAKTWKPLANFYTLMVVIFAWVLFRADTLQNALGYWKAMFNFRITTEQTSLLMNYMNLEFFLAFSLAILGSFGFFAYIGRNLEKWLVSDRLTPKLFSYGYQTVSAVFYAVILCLCSLYLVSGTYNPFIYYRF